MMKIGRTSNLGLRGKQAVSGKIKGNKSQAKPYPTKSKMVSTKKGM